MATLIQCLDMLEKKAGKKPQVVLEATGNYSTPIVSFFQKANYQVVVLNPLETHQLKKKCIRKVKTDPVDANRIAQVYYQNKPQPATCLDPFTSELRNLCRQYEGFNILYTETQLRLRSVLDLLFPNYDTVFSHIRGVTALKVISSFPSPQAVLAADRKELLALLKSSKHSDSWCEEKANQLILAAKESLPANQAQQSNTRVLKNYVEILMTHQRIMTDIRAQMIEQASLSPVFSLLLSIPGVGELTAATILGEIGDISRFPSSKQLVAFAGLDPSVFQSGKFKSTNNRISKRGSTYLRKALYQATVAGIAKRSTGILNPVLYEYYSRKVADGKPSKVAIIATSSKLLRIIYGIWTSQEPFKTN
jgi:transposase